MKNIIALVVMLTVLLLTPTAFSKGVGNGPGVIDLEKDSDPYMYLYCKKAPNNPYCQRHYAKHFYVHSLMRNGNLAEVQGSRTAPSVGGSDTNAMLASIKSDRSISPIPKPASRPRVQTRKPVKKASVPKERKKQVVQIKKKVEVARADTMVQEAGARDTMELLKPMDTHDTIAVISPEETVDDGVINGKGYLIGWIRDMYGVELDWDAYSEAALADVYSRLMWCSTIQNELGEECDYTSSSTEELRARYESTLSF